MYPQVRRRGSDTTRVAPTAPATVVRLKKVKMQAAQQPPVDNRAMEATELEMGDIREALEVALEVDMALALGVVMALVIGWDTALALEEWVVMD